MNSRGYLCLASLLLSLQWTRLTSAQSNSDSFSQPLVNSGDVSLSGTTVSEPSLFAQISASSDAASSSTALEMASSVAAASSPTLILPSASSSPSLPPASPSSFSTSGPANTVVTSISQTPSPSASVTPSASPLTGSITSNNLTQEFVGSLCSCDLHVTSCDINCCCDTDCSTEELQTFTMCLDIPPGSNSPVCVSSDYFVQSLTSFRTERVTRDNTQLFCVFIDNYPGRTMFGPPPSVSQSNIESVVQSHMEAGDILTSQSSFPYGPFYKLGDPLLSVYNSSTLDTWTLPSSLNSAFCNARTAVGYLQPLSSSCQLSISSGVTSLCSTSSPFNANLYIQRQGLLQLPVEVLTNVSMIIPVTVSTVTCVAVGGATRECGSGALPPVPTLVEGACQNVLKELSFTVCHNGSRGVTSVTVEVVLVDVPTSTTSEILQQQLTVK